MKLNLIPKDKGKKNPNRRETLNQRVQTPRFRKGLLFVVALVISSGLWLLTALNDSSNSTIEVVFPLRYADLSDKYAFEKEPPHEVVAQVEAKGFTLLRYSFNRRGDTITHFVTESDIRKKRFEVSDELMRQRVRAKLGNKVIVRSISPSNISIPFYRRNSKSVPVVNKVVPEERGGYMLYPMNIEPSNVEVYGAKSVLDKITFIATEAKHIKDIHQDEVISVPLVAPAGVTLSTERVKASIKVEVLTQQTFEVPLKVVNVPPSMQLRPFVATVDVRIVIPQSAYNRYKPSDFIAVVDYNDIHKVPQPKGGGSKKLKVRVEELPERIIRYEVSPLWVEYLLEEN